MFLVLFDLDHRLAIYHPTPGLSWQFSHWSKGQIVNFKEAVRKWAVKCKIVHNSTFWRWGIGPVLVHITHTTGCTTEPHVSWNWPQSPRCGGSLSIAKTFWHKSQLLSHVCIWHFRTGVCIWLGFCHSVCFCINCCDIFKLRFYCSLCLGMSLPSFFVCVAEYVSLCGASAKLIEITT